MKNSIVLCFVIIISILSCTPTCECDYDPRLSLNCKLIDQQGRNLVFGPAAVYSLDSIKLLKEKGDFSIHNASVNYHYKDSSILAFNFYVPATSSYIYYNQGQAEDSLTVEWVEKTGKCCGGKNTYHTIGSVKFNGVVVQSQNDIYFFRK